MSQPVRREDWMRDYQAMERRIQDLERLSHRDAQYVTKLPENAFNEQKILYKVPGFNAIWHLIYLPDLSSTYPWYYFGGPPLYNEPADGSETSTTGTTYITTNAPSIMAPLNGDYIADFGGRVYAQNPAGQSARLGLHVGGTITSYIIDSWQGSAGASITLHATHQKRSGRITGVAANATVDVRLASGAAHTATASARWLKLTPERLG